MEAQEKKKERNIDSQLPFPSQIQSMYFLLNKEVDWPRDWPNEIAPEVSKLVQIIWHDATGTADRQEMSPESANKEEEEKKS